MAETAISRVFQTGQHLYTPQPTRTSMFSVSPSFGVCRCARWMQIHNAGEGLNPAFFADTEKSKISHPIFSQDSDCRGPSLSEQRRGVSIFRQTTGSITPHQGRTLHDVSPCRRIVDQHRSPARCAPFELPLRKGPVDASGCHDWGIR